MSNDERQAETKWDDAIVGRLLTSERLHSYLSATDGDISGALRLYEWNIDASGAMMAITGMVEVIVRNALDNELALWASAHGHDDWFESVPLDAQGSRDVSRARDRATNKSRRPLLHGKVIAELSFGFWRYLAAQRYLTSLWVPALHRAFPAGHHDLRERRTEVEERLKRLLLVRNRAAHHEPLHHRDLKKDFDSAAEIVRWIDIDASRWVAAQSSLGAIVERKPGL